MKTQTKKVDCMCGTYDYKPHSMTDPHGSEVIAQTKVTHTPTPIKNRLAHMDDQKRNLPRVEYQAYHDDVDMTLGHVPLPWQLNLSTGMPFNRIESTAKKQIAECEGESIAQSEANAAYIVRCVNSHQELLAAVKGLLGYAFTHGMSAELFMKYQDGIIAKAEGK